MPNWMEVESEGVEDGEKWSAWLQRAVKFVKTLPKK